MASKVFPAKTDQLNSVIGFVEQVLEESGCPMKTIMEITVSVEEIFVNIAHYAYADKDGTMKLDIRESDKCFTFVFEDSGIPFDPLAKIDPDITLSAEDRPIGGLGIYMVKKMMDSVTYEYVDNKNILTITKKF